MKDANDLYRAGVNLRELGDKAEPYRPKGNGKTEASLVTRCAADVDPEAIEWIWQDRLARGKHTAIAGEPGLGKSQFGIFVAAAITKGGIWPNNEGNAPQGRVIILSAEDGAADTIIPRLIAAGADRRMIELVCAVKTENGKGRRSFNLQSDLQQLEAKITQLGNVQSIIIDPLSAYLGKGIDSHKDPEVRAVLEPVSNMADRLRTAIVSISHFNKSSGPATSKALHKFMGSIAFVAAPRVAFAIIEDPEDKGRRLFLHAKNNLAPPAPGLAFRIGHEIIGNGIWAPRIAWETGTVAMTADEAVSTRGKATPSLDEAKQFLAELVGPGGMDAKEIESEAKAAGLSWATVRRAKDELGLKSVKATFDGGWLWKK